MSESYDQAYFLSLVIVNVATYLELSSKGATMVRREEGNFEFLLYQIARLYFSYVSFQKIPL